MAEKDVNGGDLTRRQLLLAASGVAAGTVVSPSAQQPPSPSRSIPARGPLIWGVNFGRKDEDCLRLNIWTPGVNDQQKRPVLLWLHAGGFASWSSQFFASYDGANLARRGDVVVVSINHRLNLLGFLSLAEYGTRYAESTNLGMLDIVAALGWVRDNIGAFGGDPQCVTVFGQSGGGAKVNHLMAMPSARGLFHRAVAQSPTPLFTRTWSLGQSARSAAATLAKLGLSRDRIDQVHSLSWEQLGEAYVAAVQQDRTLDLRPAVDGTSLPEHPFQPVAPALSSHVPLLVGTVVKENGRNLIYPRTPSEAITQDELRRRVMEQHPGRADTIIDAFRNLYPTLTPVDLLERIGDTSPRNTAILQAQRKAQLKAAPAYLYQFAWQTPAFDGRPGAFHGSEVPFVFDNTDRCAPMTGGTSEARALAARMSDAWIQFARTGNPNHSGLPDWPAFTPDRVPTMVFDSTCEVKNNHDGDARNSLNP